MLRLAADLRRSTRRRPRRPGPGTVSGRRPQSHPNRSPRPLAPPL